MLEYVLFTLLLVPCLGQLCGRAALNECLQSLPRPLTTLSYHEVAQLAQSANVYVTLALPETSQLNKTCSDFQIMDACVEEQEAYCEDFMRSAAEGIRASYTYLCNDGKMDFLQHAACIGHGTASKKIHTCLQRYNEQVTRTQDGKSGSLDQLEAIEINGQLCSSMSQLIGCIKSSVGSACGDGAMEFLGEFMEQKIKFVEDDQHCYIEGGDYNTKDLLESKKATVCPDGSNIVWNIQLCDRIMDCLDGSDELSCDYAKEEERTTTIVIVMVVTGILLAFLIVTIIKAKKNTKWINKLRRRGDQQMLVDM